MQNQTPSPITTEALAAETDAPQMTPEIETTRRDRRDGAFRRYRTPILTAGAIIAVGALVGTGYAVQSESTAKAQRVADTAALALAHERDSRQGLEVDHGAVLDVRAEKQAKDTLTAAGATLASAAGKTDASALATSVAALDSYALLSPSKVFQLVGTTKQQADQVTAAVAEVDRIAAEQAAAAAAAAAAKAAAEAAAAAAAKSPSGSTGGAAPSAPVNPSEAQAIARDMMAARYGWGEDQFGCLVALWSRESGWRVNASNPSGAYGIPQALPGSKMSSAGADWATNPATQISWGLGYIAGRYGNACGAYNTALSQGWY
ncbi:lytic transglycosylase domain-containing protein [Agromyces aureus]|uniref:aggregation-promoting factor C-terminal-like domain-containing protein n=1 Tax=Agromyces aureus TaxID=453304 RepID=UPI000A3ED614|nr:lytic transglycosylase domain-containing protein [Agromyces aureus]